MVTKPKSSVTSSAEKETATEENAPKPTASTATPEPESGEGTTTFKKETRAAVESSDGEETLQTLQTNDDENDAQYSSAPLDRTAIKLPSGYRGHNVERVAQAVARIFNEGNVEKDEYEKTADYQKRISKFKEELPLQPLYGDLTFDSYLALALLPSEDDLLGAQAKYDADAERFRIIFNGGVDYWIKKFDDSLLYGIKFNEVKTSSETYIGENLYGVKKEIRESNYVSRGVVFTDSLNLALDDRESLLLRGILPSDAKEIGDSLGVLCVFKLLCVNEISDGVATPSCAVYGFWQHEATMSSPYEFSELQIAVRVTIPEFWVYNVETGQVFAKYSLQDMKTGKAKKIGDFELGKASQDAEKANAEKSDETAEEKAEREAKQSAAEIAKERRRSAAFWQDGNKRLDNRLAAVKRLTPSRDVDAPVQIAVPGDCATLQEALAEAAKKASKDVIPRVVLDAGEYDASGLALKTFVDVQSATGKPEDVVLTVDAASPITVDGETVASFDGVTLRQVGGGAKSGACVEVKRGIAFFFNCVLDGKKGASSATGVKAVGLKSAAVLRKCRATDFALSALHVEDGAFGWAVETVFGPKNRFGASSKGARLEVEKCEFRGNETGVYFGKLATGGASGNVYADNKRDAQIVDGCKVEVDAPNVEKK
ncbi:MAG: hypothetical protein IKW13_03220 [Thermoguttaceae bacterium]|nr:hypothetical protein [Thermoguttaceae bacterium]